MFAGHIGAALAIGRAERRVSVGVFVAAALLLDFLLWLFVLLGWESVAIPADFANTHQPEFVFPYSHGLLASAVWSTLAAVLAFILCSRLRARWRVATLVAVAVFRTGCWMPWCTGLSFRWRARAHIWLASPCRTTCPSRL